MKYNIILFIAIAFVISALNGCEEQKLTSYDGDNFIQFEKETSDSTNISFVFYPGQDYIDFPMVLELVGVASERDLNYSIIVDPEYTTAETKHYSIPSEQVFRAGRYIDTLYVRFNKTDDLDQGEVRLALQVESTSDLKIGKIEKAAAVIWLSNTVAQPDWWDSDIESYYLGVYSNKKYELFIKVTGIFDMSDLDASTKRSYALQFKEYLRENPTLDENNQYIEVPVF